MKHLLYIFAVFPITCMAEPLIGTVTLQYIDTPEYQPGGCDELPPDDEAECIDFADWRRYELVDFIDTRGSRLELQSAVLASHTVSGGTWLVVLEELGSEEAQKFEARFKVIDGGPVFTGGCLDRSVQDYDSALAGEPLDSEDGQVCYRIDDLQRNNGPR